VDVQIRTAIHRWLRFLHDVPAGYYHAPIKNGVLGLPLMRTLIPILKRNRLQHLDKSYSSCRMRRCRVHVRGEPVGVVREPNEDLWRSGLFYR